MKLQQFVIPTLILTGFLLGSCSKENNNLIDQPLVEGCAFFEQNQLNLNVNSIDFECRGNAFLNQDELDDANSNGTWGVFGGSVALLYQDNPSVDPTNTSSKVLAVVEEASNMPWSGFFFDLEEPIQFKQDLTAIALQVFSLEVGQSVLLKLENSNNPSQFKELVQVTTSENQWERLTYHFSVADSNQFDRLVLIMNTTFQNTAQMTYYVDSITLTKPKETSLAPPSFTDLVWSDEFDYQGRPDDSKWHHQTYAPNNGGWFNGELQHYVDRDENSYVSDGTLKIKAIHESYTTQNSTKEYTSARLNSKFSMTYGKIEVRAKLPSGAGTWPAIWTLGANINEPGNFYGDSQGSVGWPLCGEIDIMEQNGWDKTQVYGHFHWGNTQSGAYENYGKIASVSNTSTEFHVYSLVWTETELQIFIDDALNVVLDNTALNPYDNPHYLLLNIAVGGNLGGTVPANFSQEVMEVDYVRFYQ